MSHVPRRLHGLWILAVLCVGPLRAQAAPEPNAGEQRATVVEIGLAIGRVFSATIISRDEKLLVYRLPGSPEEKSLPLDEVIFIRNAGGAYEFIFPEEKPAENPPAAAAKTAEKSQGETLLLLSVGLTYSDNSALTSFTNDFAQALAADYNARLTPAGFVAQPGLEASRLSALFSAEHRWLRGVYSLGLGAGLTVIPKSSAVVSSASYSGQETVNVDGYAVPVTVIIYYRIWGDPGFGLNLGAGGGALFTSVLVTRNFGGSNDYEEVRGFAPLLIFRPELSMRAGPVTLIAALPVFWAEGRPVAADASVTEGTGRVAAASLTGAGITLAVGYGL